MWSTSYSPFPLAGILVWLLACLCNPAWAQGREGQRWFDVTLTADKPLTAGARVDLTLAVRAQVVLPRGSRLVITPHWQMPTLFQDSDPGAPGYIAAFASSQELPLRFTYRPGSVSRLYGGPEAIAESADIRLRQPVNVGEVLLIEISKLQLPAKSSASYGFEVKASPGGEGAGQSRIVPLEVVPGPPAKLNVTASSLIRPREEVELVVRVEDRLGNLVSPPTIEPGIGSSTAQSIFPLSLSLRRERQFLRQITMTEPMQLIDDVSIRRAGTHRVEVRSAGGGLRGLSNPIVVRNTQRQVTWVLVKEPIDPPHSLYDLPTLQARYRGLADMVLPSREMTSGPVALPYGWETEEETRSLGQGGSIFRLRNLDEQIQVLLAESATDFRAAAKTPLLVQMAGGDSVYGWYANEAVRAGITFGFVGINHTHQQPYQGRLTRTGVLRHRNESIFSALVRGRTFVNQGEQILIFDDIRGQALRQPGQVGLTAYVEVIAAQPIKNIELLKNGEVIKSFRESFKRKKNEERLLELTFESSNLPFGHRQSLPRNPREWVGYVRVRQGKIATETASVRTRLSASAQRLDFLTRTHGRQETARFTVTDTNEDSVIEVQIAEGYESTGWLPEDRLPAPTPLALFQFPISELNRGPAVREAVIDDYVDTVTMAWAYRESRTSRTVTWDDPGKTRTGDYYYFRVTTTDGSMAWTSPVVVGGKTIPATW